MTHPKICFATYIYGDNYQNFIPWILYSVGKSYPEYYTMLFINGTLRNDLKPLVAQIDNEIYSNYEIIENTFNDCPNMNPIKAMSFRWVLWNEKFNEFDYIYYIDSDMLFIREPIPLHEQHIAHMNYIGSDCISNILRKKYLPHGIKEWYTTYSNYKWGGVKSVFRQYLTGSVFRVSGIHFVKVPTYFRYLDKTAIHKYQGLIYNNKAFRNLAYVNDEHLLYVMLKNCGVDMSVFAVQQTSVSMFGMANPNKQEFCPHHGIHMGIFRHEIDDIPEWAKAQLESEDYRYYIEQFKKNYVNDRLFNLLLQQSPQRIKDTYKRMTIYYKINYPW